MTTTTARRSRRAPDLARRRRSIARLVMLAALVLAAMAVAVAVQHLTWPDADSSSLMAPVESAPSTMADPVSHPDD